MNLKGTAKISLKKMYGQQRSFLVHVKASGKQPYVGSALLQDLIQMQEPTLGSSHLPKTQVQGVRIHSHMTYSHTNMHK